MHEDSYKRAKRSVEALAPAERLRLLSELAASLSAELDPQPRSLMELEGLGQRRPSLPPLTFPPQYQQGPAPARL